MFTRMDQSTKEEWDHIYNEHLPHVFDMPNRIISMLEQLKGVSLGFGTDQLHHALQTATMARRANAPDEMILSVSSMILVKLSMFQIMARFVPK